jgi:uncharacterized circularly permuted ATP-grasp superfamily protein
LSIYREAISASTVTLPRAALAQMIRLVRTLFGLSQTPAYRQTVLPLVPDIARFCPGHDSVMMGYDFHLGPDGVHLIEVNTNAGGALLAYLAQFPEGELARGPLAGRLRRQFLDSFAEEMQRYSRGAKERPEHIAIIDEEPKAQYLYEEMLAFTRLFEEWGVPSSIADPQELVADADGVTLGGKRVDFVYNRHCDFYLERPEMAGLAAAYRAGTVCLSPNPFSYGLLADKRRLTLWSDPSALESLGLDETARALLAATIPESRLLSTLDRQRVWSERNDWVFKPVSRFGSRGVLLGRKISRSRFDQLDPRETLVQRLVPPSMTPTSTGGEAMKTDFRLYVYRRRVLGVAARLYQGQVTNLRTAGGGFAPVRVV